jgi:hypothetical protein
MDLLRRLDASAAAASAASGSGAPALAAAPKRTLSQVGAEDLEGSDVEEDCSCTCAARALTICLCDMGTHCTQSVADVQYLTVQCCEQASYHRCVGVDRASRMPINADVQNTFVV